jgi:AcrR family transcriptional regulator
MSMSSPTAVLEAAPEISAPGQRVVDATLRCVARWGLAKTTLDDIAREAGCSRATVYRLFPGGKDALIEAVAAAEVGRFFAALAARLDEAATLEELLVAGISEAARDLQSHEALQFLLEHEPEAVLPHFAFRSGDAVLGTVRAFAAPYLARYVPGDEAPRAAEWVARIVLSYTSCPADGVDLASEESVRKLVRTFVLPGLESQHLGRQ